MSKKTEFELQTADKQSSSQIPMSKQYKQRLMNRVLRWKIRSHRGLDLIHLTGSSIVPRRKKV